MSTSQFPGRRMNVLENPHQTYFLTVSESPMTVNDRLGRVMATALPALTHLIPQSPRPARPPAHALMQTGGGCDCETLPAGPSPSPNQRRPPNGAAAQNSEMQRRSDSPFSRRFSPRKPTSPSGLLRTRLTTTASFSRPWKPSTLPSSMPGKVSLSGARTAS